MNTDFPFSFGSVVAAANLFQCAERSKQLHFLSLKNGKRPNQNVAALAVGLGTGFRPHDLTPLAGHINYRLAVKRQRLKG